MAEIKLTKNELRSQQLRLGQLERYLPTLQLKKSMLQTQVNDVRAEIEKLNVEFKHLYSSVDAYSALLREKTSIHIEDVFKVVEVKKEYENIAGVEVPHFRGVEFAELSYSLFETPPWVDGVIAGIHDLVHAREAVAVAEEKKAALEKELREVTIRVNLFEKILIPRCLVNIKKIQVFLGDQQLAAVSQAKVAKGKIIARKNKGQELIHAS